MSVRSLSLPFSEAPTSEPNPPPLKLLEITATDHTHTLSRLLPNARYTLRISAARRTPAAVLPTHSRARVKLPASTASVTPGNVTAS